MIGGLALSATPTASHMTFRDLLTQNRLRTVIALLPLLAACGGKSNGPTGNPNTPGAFTASVDNSAFSATVAAASYINNAFIASGSQTTGSTTRTISIAVPNARNAGVYGLTIAGASATYTETTGGVTRSWSCFIGMGSGQVIFSALSASRAIATFNFTAPANAATGATGTRTIASGRIDMATNK